MEDEIKLLIFDMDDTLIDTSPIYMDVINNMLDFLEIEGVDTDEALRYFKKLEYDRSKVFKMEGFSESLKSTVNKYTNKELEAERFYRMGMSVYNTESPVKQGAMEAASVNKTKVILTKGDNNVQLGRLVSSGLASFFDQVFVTSRKTKELFLKICEFYDIPPHQAVMIGNSIDSDILPALEAGLYAIHVPNGHYDHEGPSNMENGDHDKFMVVKSLKDALEVVV